MAESTAETLYDYISEESGNAQATANAQNKVANHREFKIGASDGDQQLYLSFVDDASGQYNIPLGQVSSHEKNNSSDSDNILVPIIPAIYATHDLDPVKATVPGENGFIYIYKGDYLWRELEVQKNGKYKDVNLRIHQGKDCRAATTEMDSRIVVPYKIGGDEANISICYSEIQWSWARINVMGGMDPDDFRINQLNPPLLADAYKISKAKAKENRAARMQEVDLSGYYSGFPSKPANGKKAKLENSNDVSAEHYLLKNHADSSIPVVYLHDAIGIANYNVRRLNGVKLEFSKFIHRAADHPHYKSAAMAYKVFFDTKLYETNFPTCSEHRHKFRDQSDSADLLRECKDNIDENYIKETLKVAARKDLRKAIRDLKIIHVEFLDGKLAGKNIVDSNPDFVSVNETLKDYAELEAPGYGLLWSTFVELINILPFDPSILDKGLDLVTEHDQVPRNKDLGHLYLKSLLDSSHPLHAMLFPAKTQVDEYSEKYKVDLAEIDPVDGSGKFRPIAFAKVFEASKKSSAVKTSEDSLKLFQKIIGDLTMLSVNQIYDHSKTQTITINPLIRLSIALNDPDLSGMHLKTKGADVSEFLILDGSFNTLEKLKRSERRSEFEKAVNNPGDKRVNVIDPVTKKPFASTDITQIANNKGVPIDFNNDSWSEIFRKTDSSGVARANAEVVVVPRSSSLAAKMSLAATHAKSKSASLSSIIDFTNTKLPVLMLVFELVNLRAAISNLKKAKTKEEISKSVSKIILAVSALPFAVIEASTKLVGDAKTVSGLAKILGKVSSTKTSTKFAEKLIIAKQGTMLGVKGSFSGLSRVSVGFAGAGAIMSGWDMIDAFLSEDNDAAVAYGVQMVAGVGLALTTIGAASSAGLGFLFVLGPWGWAFLAAVIIAGVFAAMFTDSDLEKWAKHGPFAIADDRLTHDYIGKSGHDTHEALLALLMPPQIQIIEDKDKQLVYVDVHASGFEPGKSTLTIHARFTQGDFINGAGPIFERTQQELKIVSWTPIVDDKNPSITHGLRYIYKRPNKAISTKIYARVQHITKDKFIIPTKPGVSTTKVADPKFIDETINGWSYANPL
ncbi:hypothetical protein MNBD_GAMMA22-1164, partial [hydrothermal vent metagenome]